MGEPTSRCFVRRRAPSVSETCQSWWPLSSTLSGAAESPEEWRSRRPDSNRGPLHYELWAAVTTSHRQSPQVTPGAESSDWR
jgi:hypothetical protein